MQFKSVLRAASPFGPIFGKELRITARRKRSYWLRVGYLAALLLFLLMVYASLGGVYGGMGVAARSQRLTLLGSVFFACFTIFSVFAMGLIGPVLTCTAVGGERLHKTLLVLLMTPISAWQIVAGKLLSRLLVALTLIGLSLPVLALVRLLGGVELEDMVAVVCVAAGAALGSAAIGLFFSTISNRAYLAIIASYVILVLLYVFVPFVVIALRYDFNGPAPPPSVFEWLSIFNPFFLSLLVAKGRLILRAGSITSPWLGCVAVQVAMSALLLAASALLIRRGAKREGERPKKEQSPDALPPAETIGDGEKTSKVSKKNRKPRVARDVGDNPIIWREVRRPLLATRRQSVIGGLVCVLLVVGWFIAYGRNKWANEYDAHLAYSMVYNGFGWMLAAVLAATAIAQEKEGDTWTLLLATPVSGNAVVWGKALGVLRRLMWPTVFVAGHFLLFAMLGVLDFAALVLVVWVIVSFNSLWVATGIYLSLRLRRVTTAVIINLMLAVGIYVFVPVTLEMISGFTRVHTLTENVCWYLPYYYLGSGMEGMDRWHRDPRFHHSLVSLDFELPTIDHRVAGYEFLVVILLAGLAHLIIAGLILAYTAWRFDALVARAPQRSYLSMEKLMRERAQRQLVT